MKTREKDKEILGRDRDDIGRLIAKGLVDGDDVIQSYINCGEFDRADAMRDALNVKVALSELSSTIKKYSTGTANLQQSQRHFGFFNRAYASLNHCQYTDDINYVGTDMGGISETYMRVLNRK